MTALPRSVCVFCGSSPGRDPVHLRNAERFGHVLAAAGVTLVYGGGGVGLMGACARAALAGGGRVIGVIPEFLCTPELALKEVELQVVASMHERKAAMFDLADAIVVLPGGIGTLEEIVEILSWGRLNLHRKPVVFLDTDGYWRPLASLVEHTVREGFTPAAFTDLYAFASDVEAILPALQAMTSPQSRATRDLALI